ncbi:MAG: rhomboid family intramembrane serine protease [Myxococcales bacterium]|nr:rhomboid family intramembrane serine protease [Myxococcales bacterium]
MELNHVLVWLTGITVVSWLVALLRAQGNLALTSWVLTSVGVLALWVAGIILWPDTVGFVTLGAWALFLLLPQLGARLVQSLSLRGRYRAALWVARALAVLHPTRVWRQQPGAFQALAHLQAGQRERAERALARLERADPSLRLFATMQRFRAEGRWRALVEWVEGHPDREALLMDPVASGNYLRALGETGARAEMARVYIRVVHGRGVPSRAAYQIVVAGLCGHVELVRKLLTGPLRVYGSELSRFWEGTARWAAGEPGEAEALLRPLLAARDHIVRAAARARLDAIESTPPGDDDPQITRALRLIEQDLARGEAIRAQLEAERVRPWMTYALVGLELLAYLREVPGGTTNEENLLELGAMIGPLALLQGEWWRLLTAGFLHYGWLHLALNSLGIVAFGRRLERDVGPWRFLGFYLLTSVGAMTAMLLISEFVTGEEFVLVGASASLMGIVGVSGAVTLRRYLRSRASHERRWLLSLALIIGLQTAFDLSTPQVSVGAHLGGVLIGFALGLVFAPATPYYQARAERTLARQET